jgi:PAS domain S-box-containing protein
MAKGTEATERNHGAIDWSDRAVALVSALGAAEAPAMFVLDADGKVLLWNDGAARLFGQGRAEVLGSDGVAALCAPGDREGADALRRATEELHAPGAGRSCTVRTVRSDGTRGWAAITLLSVPDENRTTVGVAGIAHDLTDERENLERMEKSGERYRTLLQLLPDIVYVVSPEGKFVFVSDSVSALGYSPDDLVGRHFSALIHPDDYRAVSREHVLPRYAGRSTGDANAPKLFDERRSGGRKTTNLEVRLVRKGGGSPGGDRIAIVSAVNASGHYSSRARDDGGEHTFLGTIGVIRDITERKRTEDERRKLEGRLHQARKMEAIGQLAGGIAHDFNNMLSGISGYAEVIKRRNRVRDGAVRDEGLDKHIGVIIKAAERAGDLTTKLLAFSRQGKYEVVPIDMHETIHDVIGLLQHTIDRRIEIRQLLKAVRPTILGDRAQIENAVLNLAMNACDAMPEGGKLSFGTDIVELSPAYVESLPYDMNPGAYVLLTVSDTGTGMDSETCERIFEPFFTTKVDGKGTGLGLASVYGTVKSHHGAIEVHSTPGNGSVFSVYFPCGVEAQEPIHDDEQEVIRKGSGTVLVVDDEEIVRDILSRVLEELGYRVELCGNGREALDTYRRRRTEIDLVVLDMNMPVMGGADCFRELKKLNPDVRVLMTTGYTHASMMREIRQLGAAGMILKPFKFAALADQIRRAMEA